MTAPPDADPAPATEVAGAGSRRPGVVPLLVVAVVLTAVVQGVLLQSSFVPTSALAPDLEGRRPRARLEGAAGGGRG